MYYEETSYKLIIFEAFICAFFIGITQRSWLWFFGSLIGVAVLLMLPVVGGAIGIFMSLFIAIAVGSIFSDATTKWYVATVAFIIFIFLHSSISASCMAFFGIAIVIFEAFVLSGTINMATGKIALPIIIFIVLLILSFVPLLRLIEYIALSILTLLEVYNTVAESVPAPHTYIITSLIFILLTYYFYMVYFAIDYKGIIQTGKKTRIIKKVNKLFPYLERNGSEFEHILNRCYGERERESFLMDWDNYKLTIWAVIKKRDKSNVTKPPFGFEDWYRANERWKYTSYYHAYYQKQILEDNYIEQEKDRLRRLWTCDYCGRLNYKNQYQCPACGALQKMIVPEK